MATKAPAAVVKPEAKVTATLLHFQLAATAFVPQFQDGATQVSMLSLLSESRKYEFERKSLIK